MGFIFGKFCEELYYISWLFDVCNRTNNKKKANSLKQFAFVFFIQFYISHNIPISTYGNNRLTAFKKIIYNEIDL